MPIVDVVRHSQNEGIHVSEHKCLAAASAKSTIIVTCLLASMSAGAQGNYYVKAHAGISLVQDNDFGQSGVAGAGASGDGSYDTGFATGLAVGYRYGNGFSAELDWEYRRNDNDAVVFSDGTRFDDGDIASNTFYLNGYYAFDKTFGKVRPYIGAGVGWIQEIDLDLESGGTETSYSSDGDVAWQLMVGAETELSANWRLQGELRYTQVAGVDLDEEGGPGRIKDLDYDAWSIGVGVVYDF
jgi:opacity protein-like surface antigen